MAYSYDRTAAAHFSPDTVKEIARYTDNNDVVKALVTGAKMLGLTQMVKKLELVGKIQELEGHLPSGLKQYREGLYDELMAEAKRVLGDAEYKQFYGSY
jgi:hypothetical protein